MTKVQVGLTVGFVVLMSAALFLIGLGRRHATVRIDERLAHVADRSSTLAQDELSESFASRVLKPALWRSSRWSEAFAPGKSSERMAATLAEAGNPVGIGVAEVVALRFVLAIVLGVGALLLFSVGGGLDQLPDGRRAAPVGFMLPGLGLSRKAKKRKKEIVRSLPDASDLLTITVESGLGFDPALMRVAETWHNALTWEFARVLPEMWIGKNRRDALREMATLVERGRPADVHQRGGAGRPARAADLPRVEDQAGGDADPAAAAGGRSWRTRRRSRCCFRRSS